MFLVVLGGIVVFAAGMRRAVVGYDAPASLATAVLLSGELAAYLCGIASTRWRLGLGPPWPRLALAFLCLPAAVVGAWGSPLAQLTLLAAVLVAGNVREPQAFARRSTA